MTKQELTIVYNKNIIQLQNLTIKKLTQANSFLGLPSFRQRELNRENIYCLKQMTKILKRNYKKDLKDCTEDLSEDMMPVDKVEQIVAEKVGQSDF